MELPGPQGHRQCHRRPSGRIGHTGGLRHRCERGAALPWQNRRFAGSRRDKEPGPQDRARRDPVEPGNRQEGSQGVRLLHQERLTELTGLMLLMVTTLLPAGAAAQTAPAASAAAESHPTAAPDVQPIDSPGYLRLVSSMKGHPLVVNVWATWCDPCREEFPDIVRFHREMGPRGVEVAAISLDMPSALKTDVVPFLAANGATFHLFLKTPGGDEEFINTVDPGWSGALPATFVYDL